MLFELPESGAAVRFQLAHAVCPDFNQIIDRITDGLNVSGTVLYTSDSGSEKNRYAIVEVPGIQAPVIVPIEQLAQEGDSVAVTAEQEMSE